MFIYDVLFSGLLMFNVQDLTVLEIEQTKKIQNKTGNKTQKQTNKNNRKFNSVLMRYISGDAVNFID